MRAHYFQHVPFEGPGSIEPWLKSNGYTLTCTRFYESVRLPDPGEVDFLVIMGGPMSVNDTEKFAWIVSETRFVREVIEGGKPVLGICLGAQIIASAMGAKVFPNPVKEIGWFPINGVVAGLVLGVDSGVDSIDGAVFCFPPSETVFHWHGETFDLPPGAIRLAGSDGCENQAFQLGRSVMGLQFHLETTPELASALVSHCSDELLPSAYVQTGETILSASQARYQSINRLMASVLAFLHQNNR